MNRRFGLLYLPATVLLLAVGVMYLRRGREQSSRQLPNSTKPTSDLSIVLPPVAPGRESSLPGLLGELCDALSRADQAAVSRISKELASLGDWALPHAIHQVLIQDSPVSELLLGTFLEAFPHLTAVSAIIEQSAGINWHVLGKDSRKKRLQRASQMLALSTTRSRINISALLEKQFEVSRSKTGKIALAIMAMRCRAEGWLGLVRKVLASPGESDACDELVETMGEALDAAGSTALLALFFERDCEKYKNELAQAVGRVLPADQALMLLLGAAQAKSSAADQTAISEVVARIVSELSNGMGLIRAAWAKVEDDSARLSILYGLGSLKTRSDVGDFLMEIARSPVDAQVAGTALISLSRLDTHKPQSLAMCLGTLSTPPGKDLDEQLNYKMSAIFSLENLYSAGLYPLETVQAYRDALAHEKDPRMVRSVIDSASKLQMVQLNAQIFQLGASHPDASVRDAARHFLSAKK